MQLATKQLTPETVHPNRRRSYSRETQLEVTVIFTSIPQTIAALRAAGELASRLHARITLLATQVVQIGRAHV